MKLNTKRDITIVIICLSMIFIISGCSMLPISIGRKHSEAQVIVVEDTTPKRKIGVTDHSTDEYLAEIYPTNKEELLRLLYYKDKIIDSLYTKIDYLYFQVDSLYQDLGFFNGRITLNQDFEIPRKFEFAGRPFDLSNDRVYHMFSEIFNRELKAAHRYIPRSGMYFPLFESVLAAYDIPDDIKYLAIAESGLSSMATSQVGAGGIWQFMPATARSYNLKIDSFVDERRNIIKATDAAARYLTNSYRYLGRLGAEDWLLAMCAYNAGDGSVARVIREQQAHDFFDLIMRVDETNRYVWRSAAIKLIFDNEETLFGERFEREPSILDITRQETIKLNGHHRIDDWVKAQGTVLRRVWELNPWINLYQRQRSRYSAINDVVLPAGEYTILLPSDSEPDKNLVTKAEKAFSDTNTGYFTYHTVQRGDTLYGIARRYGVTIAGIQSANNMSSNVIRPGQRLQLFGASGGTAGTATGTASGGSGRIGSDVYTVQRGDTLSGIATRSNTTVANIRAINNLTGDVIRVGQALRLRSESSAAGSSQQYVVRSGDTLSGIAQRLNVSSNHLIARNNLRVQQRGNQQIVIIQPGQVLHY